MPDLRDFHLLDAAMQAALLLDAREHLARSFGSGLSWADQERIIAAYLRRKGVRYPGLQSDRMPDE